MVPLTCAQWLVVNKNNGNNPNLANLRRFYERYVKKEMDRLRTKAMVQYWASPADTRREEMAAALKGGDYQTARQRMDDLIVILNGICRQLGEDFHMLDPVARYSFDPDHGWKSPEQAVEAMDNLAAGDGLPVRHPRGVAPDIPGLRWSTAKQNLPRNLTHLIRDIRNAAGAGGFVDERSQQQLDSRSITPKPPATLRSWHMNDQGALPEIAGAVPGSALHAHYTATSQKPGNTANNSPAPIGYAEYTGCGIESDAHNVKLVFDYVQQGMYVTVTHYKRWNKSNAVPPVYTILSKVDGTYSAWFYIDFAL